MSKESRAFTFLACALMVLSPILFLAVPGEASGPATDATSRWDDWARIEPGSMITVKRGSFYNNSHYFPIPRGATVLDSRITISPEPLTPNSKEYLRNVSFNIGKGPKEYGFSQWTSGFYTGDWGRQDGNITGVKEQRNMDLSTSTQYKYLFVLPKNASVSQANFNLTGHQRSTEFINYSLNSPFTSGGRFTASVQVVSWSSANPLVLAGAPYDNGETGAVQYTYYSGSAFSSGTFATGRTTYSQFGHALSETVVLKSVGSAVAIGAPTEQLSKAGSVHLYDTSSFSELDSFSGNDSSGRFGHALSVGNLDLDSDPELAVGAPSSLSGRGKVYVLDVVTSPGTFSTYTSLKAVLQGKIGDTNFGKALSIGDWNGDGREDLAIASDKEVSIVYGGSNMDPDMALSPLSDTGLSEIGAVAFIPTQTSSSKEDLYVGCPDINGGKVAVYYGSATPDPTVDKLIDAPSGAKDFGTSIAKFRDLNADGYSEIAIGAPGPLSSPGWVGIMDVRAPTPALLRSLPGRSNGDRFGHSLAVSDLRNDNFADIVIGAPEFKGSSVIGNGFQWICEYYDINSLPSNTPFIKIGSNEVWRYSGSHLRGTTTLDIGSAIDQAVKDKTPFLSTPTDQFVGVEFVLDTIATNNKESTGTFDIFDYDIRYSYNVELKEDINRAFNSYIKANPESVDADGTYHVPFELSSVKPGKLSVFSFGIELDLVPYLKKPISDLYIDEDTTVDRLLDLRTVIEDDRTSSVYLGFSVTTRGMNSSKVAVSIFEGHFLSVRSPSREEFRNWSGEVALTLSATDALGGVFISPDITLHVRSVNDAPAVIGSPPTLGKQDTLYQFDFEAVDAEMDPISFTLDGPENMTIDQNGVLTWTPSPYQVGEQGYSLILGDGNRTRTYNYSVMVLNVNDPPYFLTPPPNVTGVMLGETFRYRVRAADPDPEDSISYSMDGPSGALIDTDSGLIVWTPEIFIPVPVEFEVRAFDKEGLKAEMDFQLRVLVEDDPPRVISSPVRNLKDSRLWYYIVEVFDPNDDVVIIGLMSGPKGMTYDSWTNNLSWTPDATQLGDFDVSMSVRSTSFLIYHNFTLTVTRSERTWDLRLTTHRQGDVIKGKVKLGGHVSVSPGAVERVEIGIDQGDRVNCSLSKDIWTHDLDTRKLKDGEHIIYLRAYDGHSYSDEVVVKLTVKNARTPFPVLQVLGALVLVVVLIGVGVLLFLLIRRRNLERIKDEQAKQQKEALEASRKEMDRFLAMTGHIEQGKDYTKMEVSSLDAGERSKEIDAIFQPLNIQRTAQEDEGPVDLPEDILAKAKLSSLVMEGGSMDVAPAPEEVSDGPRPPSEDPTGP